MMDLMILEQFLEGLPTRASSWVRCHRPGTVDEAVTLAEDHLPGGGPGGHSPQPGAAEKIRGSRIGSPSL